MNDTYEAYSSTPDPSHTWTTAALVVVSHRSTETVATSTSQTERYSSTTISPGTTYTSGQWNDAITVITMLVAAMVVIVMIVTITIIRLDKSRPDFAKTKSMQTKNRASHDREALTMFEQRETKNLRADSHSKTLKSIKSHKSPLVAGQNQEIGSKSAPRSPRYL